MENFKKEIKKKFIIWTMMYISMFTAGFVLVLLNAFDILKPLNNDSTFLGGFIGGGAVALKYSLDYKKALKNEEKLKQLLVRDGDERMILINKCGYQLASILTLILLFIAAIIFTYINTVISNTLLFVLLGFGVLLTISTLYYNKKY